MFVRPSLSLTVLILGSSGVRRIVLTASLLTSARGTCRVRPLVARKTGPTVFGTPEAGLEKRAAQGFLGCAKIRTFLGTRVQRRSASSLVTAIQPVGEPLAGNPHPGSDEREVETEHVEANEPPATERVDNRYAPPIPPRHLSTLPLDAPLVIFIARRVATTHNSLKIL